MKIIFDSVVFILFLKKIYDEEVIKSTTDYCKGILISEKLKKKTNYMVKCINKEDLNNYVFYNNVIIFVRFDTIYKHSGLTKKIKLMKANGNVLIHDMVDCVSNCPIKKEKKLKKYLKYEDIFDYLIVFSHHMKKYLEKMVNADIRVIYSHYDPRIKNVGEKKKELIYVGSNSKINIDLNKIDKIYNKNCGLDYLLKSYPCVHISYIKPVRMYYHFNGTGKLPTSFKTNSIFICNKNPLHLEILGENYEFYIDNEEELEKVKESAYEVLMDENKYNNYLQKYNYIKDKFNIDTLINDYIKLIEEVKPWKDK